jgi:hypothetical protein
MTRLPLASRVAAITMAVKRMIIEIIWKVDKELAEKERSSEC